MNLTSVKEGVTIALDALRNNKVRSGLTILGIVIGVATVMSMAAAITGFRGSMLEGLQSMGPKNFIVNRFDQTQIVLVDDEENAPWAGKPAITFREAALIEQLPSVRTVVTAIDHQGSVKYRSRRVDDAFLMGRGPEWTEYSSGDFLEGRNFLPTDESRSSPVIVISDGLAEALFQNTRATGKAVRVRGEQFTVVGVYKQTENLFSGAFRNWAVVPTTTAFKRLGADRDWMSLLVVPATTSTQAEAMDDVAASLRLARGLRPGQENDFALVRQEQFLELFNRLTAVFFLVMLVLAGIGLLVGGVGVVGIMMISVTERTREIGVRKALGATPREILWQFLVESMTVTVIGAAIGLLIAMGFAAFLSAATPVPAAIPVWAIVTSILVAAIGGMGFGLYPAFRAARLDPVEALRYE
ncbi:MAG TPA: ABC transporter permease [Longimicrobium sp.]|nr:ABC transporter permease [Longimicrobium sp.]